MEGLIFSRPRPLSAADDLQNFDCGVESLDEWLKRRALANQMAGASRVYLLKKDEQLAGYYCLSSGAILRSGAPAPIRRNMPDPIPVALLGRLAIDRRFQGLGLGRALLADAYRRSLAASKVIGLRGLVVHALSEDARRFYLANGFTALPSDPMMLVLSVQDSRVR